MASRLITADTSVVIPLISPWHDEHSTVIGPAGPVTRLAGHVLLETVSSVSRLPHGLSTPIASAVDVLESRFPDAPFTLDSADLRRLLSLMAVAPIQGGQVYDALIGFTARLAGATLLTLDHRAERTYQAIGVDYELVG